HYKRLDIKFPEGERQIVARRLRDAEPDSLDGSKIVKKDTTDGFRFSSADGSWLLIRFSGTEPLLRIYSESSSQTRVERLLKLGRKMTGV
ncbi:MAG: phosphoglucomutase/phosphomannomutase family protein, partial [Dehalococcoidales bacterium]